MKTEKVKSVTSTIDWETEVLNLVKDESTINAEIDELESRRQALIDLHIASLDARIKARKDEIQANRERLKSYALVLFSETGDKKPHSLLKVVETSAPKWETEKMIEWCLDPENKAISFIKYSIDRAKVKNAIKNGAPVIKKMPYEIETSAHVRISDISHLANLSKSEGK